MSMINRRALGLSLAAAAASGAAAASVQFDVAAVVNAAAGHVREQYVDPAQANVMADRLLARLAEGAYATNSRIELARRLTADLQAWTNDLHMQVSYLPPAPTEAPEATPEDAMHPRTTGWGVQTVARLQGNIGLLRVTHFPSPVIRVAQRFASAMELLRDTAALILDLRVHHGGGTDTYGYFLSYFLDSQVEFSRMRWRHEGLEIIRTTPELLGPRYGETRPVFVAISQGTFSAGEAVALELKNRRGATLIGRTTRGGANGGNAFELPNDFEIFVVMGRTEGPNWEGRGVAPDIDMAPEQAVAAAHRMALARLMEAEPEPMRVQILSNVAAGGIENLSSFDFRPTRRR